MIKAFMILSLGFSLTSSAFARNAVIEKYEISSVKSKTTEGALSVHIKASAVASEACCETTRAHATLEWIDREDGKSAIVAVIRRMFIARKAPCAVVANPKSMAVEATFEIAQDQLSQFSLLNVNEFGNDLSLSDLVTADDVVVSSVPAVELTDCAVILNARPVMCTMQFDPSTCTFGDIEVRGSNSCAARANLQRTICHTLASFDTKAITCTSGERM